MLAVLKCGVSLERVRESGHLRENPEQFFDHLCSHPQFFFPVAAQCSTELEEAKQNFEQIVRERLVKTIKNGEMSLDTARIFLWFDDDESDLVHAVLAEVPSDRPPLTESGGLAASLKLEHVPSEVLYDLQHSLNGKVVCRSEPEHECASLEGQSLMWVVGLASCQIESCVINHIYGCVGALITRSSIQAIEKSDITAISHCSVLRVRGCYIRRVEYSTVSILEDTTMTPNIAGVLNTRDTRGNLCLHTTVSGMKRFQPDEQPDDPDELRNLWRSKFVESLSKDPVGIRNFSVVASF